VDKESTESDGGAWNEMERTQPGQGVLTGIDEHQSSGAAPIQVEQRRKGEKSQQQNIGTSI